MKTKNQKSNKIDKKRLIALAFSIIKAILLITALLIIINLLFFTEYNNGHYVINFVVSFLTLIIIVSLIIYE